MLLIAAILLSAIACGRRSSVPVHYPPKLVPINTVLELMPGQKYCVTFEDTGDAPFDAMDRTPIILKLDDYGGPIDARTAALLEHVSAIGGGAAPGIITSAVGPK